MTTDVSNRSEPQLISTSLPSPAVSRVVSVVVTVHFVLIGLSYLSTVASSTTQTLILDLFRPYLAVMHFDADGLPLCFATSDRAEKTHLLQQAKNAHAQVDEDWTKIDDPGFVGGDRQRRWQRYLASVAELGNNEQTMLAAWLIEPLAMVNLDAKELRIVRQPDLATTVVDDAAAPPYTAAIVRQEDGSVRLVQLPPPRLAAESTTSKPAAEIPGVDRE